MEWTGCVVIIVLLCYYKAECLEIVSLESNRAIVVRCLSVDIKCQVSSNEAFIWWTLNGRNVSEVLKDVTEERQEEKSTITISCPHAHHSGDYTCHAVMKENVDTYTNKSIYLNVQALSSVVHVYSKSYVVAKLDDEIKLKCTSTADTSWNELAIDYPRWSKNDRDVYGHQLTKKIDGDRFELTLTISRFTLSDAGLYTCKVGSSWHPIISNTHLIASSAFAPTRFNVKMLNQSNSSSALLHWPLLHLDSAQIQFYLLNISYNDEMTTITIWVDNETDSFVDNMKMHMWQPPHEETFYTFTICACLSKGICSDYSQPTVLAYFKNFEKPENVIVYCRHDNISLESFLDVTWDTPFSSKLLPENLVYQVEVTGRSHFRTSQGDIRFDTETHTYTSSNVWWRQRMKSNTNYSVQVCVQTAFGCGKQSLYSSSTSCSTPPSVPAEIPSLALQNVPDYDCDCLYLDLVRVTERYGRIRCYRVILYKLKEGQVEIPDSSTMDVTSYYAVHSEMGYGAYVAESFSSDDFKPEVVLGDEVQSECHLRFEEDNNKRKRRNEVSEDEESQNGENLNTQIYDGKLELGASYSGFVEIIVDGSSGKELRRRSTMFPAIEITSRESDSNALPTAVGIICGLLAVILILIVALCLLRRKRNLGRPLRDAPILPQPNIQSVEKDQLVSAYLERHKDSDLLFQREYELLPEYFKDRTSNASDNLDNVFKNRYPDIKAYDQTRVKLKAVSGSSGSDYINANFVPGYKNRKKFICAQGPLEKTINDFWRMIWEQRVEIIVMVTGLEENGKCKCAKYWPESGEVVYNELIVMRTEELAYGEYSIRQFLVKAAASTSEPLAVTQWHYTAWRDFLAPDRPGGILKFMKRIYGTWRKPSVNPLLVHCSAGVGRSGTLIALDTLLEQLEEEGQINVYQTVAELRRHRNFMVQSLTQYIFIYRAIMEHHQFGYTEIDLDSLTAHLKTLESGGDGEMTLLKAEFNKLDDVVEDHKTTDFGSMGPNITKNRYDYILPFDKNRVVLSLIPKEDASTYINASTILGYDRSISHILTQDPLETTIGDFWRMVHEQHASVIVMLSKSVGNVEKDECPVYWPEDEEPRRFEHIVVSLVEEVENEERVKREFQVTSKLSSKEVKVIQFQFKHWTSNLPESHHLLRLVEEVSKLTTEGERNDPVVVHCSNGSERSSLFTAISLIVGQAKRENRVDVFHTVCNLRSERQLVIPTLDHYHFCYKAILEYAKCDRNGE